MKPHSDILESMTEWLQARNIGALGTHVQGRHNPVTFKASQAPTLTEIEAKTINAIFARQESSSLMQEIEKFQVKKIEGCCRKTLSEFNTDFRAPCKEAKICYATWSDERKYRITGTTCYGFFTYARNKKPNWPAKCEAYFTPKDFRTGYTGYGKKTEKEARDTYTQSTKKTVIEVGLVVSQRNPWLAVSPDGIIINEDNGSFELLEIKCPFKGKTMTVRDAIRDSFGKCLNMKNEPISLKKKHKYYGQVQRGMAILNIKETSFVIYATCDKSLIDVKVIFDENFVTEMLLQLKKVYCNVMLPQICLRKNDGDHSVDENHNSVNVL